MASSKVIVTIAPTGGHGQQIAESQSSDANRRKIAEDVLRCYNEGASVRCRARPQTGRPGDVQSGNLSGDQRFSFAKKCDIVINNSTGGGINGDMVRRAPNGYHEIMWDERLKGMEAGAEMCTLDPTTIVASFRRPRNTDEYLAFAMSSACAIDERKRHKAGVGGVQPRRNLLQDVMACLDAGLDEPPYFINFVSRRRSRFSGSHALHAKDFSSRWSS